MDSVDWESETAKALRETFGKYVFTLPNQEPYYDLTFMQRFPLSTRAYYGIQEYYVAAPIDDSTTVAAQVRAFLDESTEQRVREGESFALWWINGTRINMP